MSDAHNRDRPRSVFTDEVLQSIPLWLDLGADRYDIADILGTTPNSLAVTCSREGIPLRPSGIGIRRGLGRERWAKLREEAAQRGISVAQLTVDIVATVVDDNLYHAVLDDGSEDGS